MPGRVYVSVDHPEAMTSSSSPWMATLAGDLSMMPDHVLFLFAALYVP